MYILTQVLTKQVALYVVLVLYDVYTMYGR